MNCCFDIQLNTDEKYPVKIVKEKQRIIEILAYRINCF